MARQRASAPTFSALEDDYYVVLGDLGDDRYIVRMFIGDGTYDEELETPLGELHKTIVGRMKALTRKPNRKLLVDATRPAAHPGHAVMVEDSE